MRHLERVILHLLAWSEKTDHEGQRTFQVRLFKPVDDEAGPIILQTLFAEQRAMDLLLCIQISDLNDSPNLSSPRGLKLRKVNPQTFLTMPSASLRAFLSLTDEVRLKR